MKNGCNVVMREGGNAVSRFGAPVLSAWLDGAEAMAGLVAPMPGDGSSATWGAASREQRVRVDSALVALGLPSPRPWGSLAPRPSLDLAMAVALAGVAAPPDVALVGELGLDGTLRPVRGALALARAALTAGARLVVMHDGQAREAARDLPLTGVALKSSSLREARSLAEVLEGLAGRGPLPEAAPCHFPPTVEVPTFADMAPAPGLAEARAAIEARLAAGHGPACALLVGPPGSGRTMLARRVPSLLARPSGEGLTETLLTLSVAGIEARPPFVPFRAPHHTVSAQGLVGSRARPGEAALAHGGVLFLDEVAEFSRLALESLGAALREGRDASGRPCRPAAVILASHPCPCGFAGSATRACRCPPGAGAKYGERVERHAAAVAGASGFARVRLGA